jgi:hypothetical protein
MKTVKQNLTKVNELNNEVIFNLLANCTKSTICHIEYIVDDSSARQINGKIAVQKQVKVNNVYLNHNYKNKVENLTGEEFTPEKNKGKERLCSTILKSLKTNKLLIDGKVLNSEAVTILGYFHEGNPITREQAESLNLFKPKSEKPKTAGRGAVSEEDNFWFVNTSFDNIIYLKIFGIEYRR